MSHEESVPEPGITWSGLARVLARESQVVLVGKNGAPLVHPIEFEDESVRDELKPTQVRVASADYSQPWRVGLKKDIADHNTEISIEELTSFLHDIKKRSRIMFGDLHDVVADAPHTLSLPTLFSDQRLRKQERHLKVIAEALRFSVGAGEVEDIHMAHGIIEKIETLADLRRTAKDVQISGIDPGENVANHPSYAKARKVLLQTGADPDVRMKKAQRAQQLYESLVSDPRQTAAFAGQLVSDIVEVSSDMHYFEMLRQLRNKGVDVGTIRESVRQTVSLVSDWGIGKDAQLEAAKSITQQLQPIIEYIRDFPHDSDVVAFSRMDTLTLESAVCAGKTRMLLDFFRRMEGISSYEAAPLIRSDGVTRRHAFVYLSPKLSRDTLIEIDANYGSDTKDHAPFGCEVNIYQKDETDSMTVDEFTRRHDYFSEKMHLYDHGRIETYSCVYGARLHPYVQLLPPNRFESVNYAEDYRAILDNPKVTRESRLVLLQEMEYLLRHDAKIFQHPTALLLLARMYSDDGYRDLLTRGSFDEYTARILDGLASIDQFRRMSPMDPDGAVAFSFWLSLPVVNQGPVAEHEKRTVALFAECERVLEEMYGMWPTEDTARLQKKFRSHIHATFGYKEADKLMKRKYASWEEASKATRHFLYDATVSPITAKALREYGKYSSEGEQTG